MKEPIQVDPDAVVVDTGGEWVQMRLHRVTYDQLQRAKAKLFLMRQQTPDILPEWFAGRSLTNSNLVAYLIYCYEQLTALKQKEDRRGKK